MKFSCQTSELHHALQLVSRAIGGQQALPILGNILLQVEGKRCTVSATDLELSIITSFEASIENEGSITVPSKAILNFIQYNSDPEVLLETVEGTQLRCISKHSKATLAGESANDYPTIAPVEKKLSFTLPLDPLLKALHYVTFASAKTSLRPVLSGVYVRSERGRILLVATDSYRLSEYSIPTEGIEDDFTCIIPAKILEEVKTILSGVKGEKMEKPEGEEKKSGRSAKTIDVTLSAQQIEIAVGHTHLLSRLIEGKFPDYRQIIPKEETAQVIFSISDLLPAVKRMHYFAKEVNNNLTFTVSDKEVHIMTPETQSGRDESILPADVTGSATKIALSSSYLLDYLGHLGGETTVMHVADALRPAIFTLPDEPNLLHLIMPLRMSE